MKPTTRHSLLLALALSMVAASQADSQSVKLGFSNYKQALLAKDGARAASAVSANSLSYYGRMRTLALSGTKPQVQARDGTEQILILGLRVRAPSAILKSGSPADLIAYAVDEGMISPGTVARTELGQVTIEGDLAEAELVLDGKPVSGGVFRFHHEGTSWKFDLEHASMLARGLFRALAEKRGVSEEALILDLLSRASGRPIGEEVWTPPGSR